MLDGLASVVMSIVSDLFLICPASVASVFVTVLLFLLDFGFVLSALIVAGFCFDFSESSSESVIDDFDDLAVLVALIFPVCWFRVTLTNFS